MPEYDGKKYAYTEKGHGELLNALKEAARKKKKKKK
tara:strand:- start:6695 stop:6802 length:108 start_codon:yes stop_codon:yes gene_type:complete